ncbi:MAG: tRNA epoxyqueuosine(34) reductase QueG, partial [Bacteroidota bacterium]
MNPSYCIKTYALELGFSKVGIARAETLEDEGVHLSEWLGRGYQASMRWMERDIQKRSAPGNIVSGAKSIVCVAMNYYSSQQHSSELQHGRISRYAWGDDYHEIVGAKLENLFRYIQSLIPGCHGKYYVDTGPVMEKAWAVRAGIGWLGKNANVLTRELGSWIFLGEIILDAELEYDEPGFDLCGSCTACLDACPTGAIVEDRVIDSNRCISYLTIEHRGDLPEALAGKFDRWIYGCDICQDVCPWNSFAKETKEKGFSPRQENSAPNLEEVASMTPDEFSKRFAKSAVKRTKHSGLVRNAKFILK